MPAANRAIAPVAQKNPWSVPDRPDEMRLDPFAATGAPIGAPTGAPGQLALGAGVA